jgi:3-oxoacyl-(acyl-carrier-protein) synthase
VSEIFVNGCGAVSPAGWGMDTLRKAIQLKMALPVGSMTRPGWEESLRVRTVPPPANRPDFLGHPRLRRSSAITQYAVGAALEALGGAYSPDFHGRLGIILCVFSGAVHYSRRFYDETLKDPATASPLLFPETVFNAPASHLAAFLGTTAVNYTCVGDVGVFLTSLALAAQWIYQERVESCLVVGTEEIDWLTADALRLFDRKLVPSEGAGAILLSRKPSGIMLTAVTNEHLYTAASPDVALARMRVELTKAGESQLVMSNAISGSRVFRAESNLWPMQFKKGNLSRPKDILGEGLMAAAAWQTVLAVDAIQTSGAESALVSIAGLHQHAVGAKFSRADNGKIL